MLGVTRQESDRACTCVLGVSTQESEWPCICLLGVANQEGERPMYMCVRCNKSGK